MEKKILFPKLGGLMHGGDYNPEQWLDRPDILQEDIRMMKKAGINCATLGVFSWSVYERSEGEFCFEWLEKVMNDLYENGIYTILATPSGARPAWLDEKYPEAMRVGADGMRAHHGMRHNHCMSSPKYREKVAVLDRKLAERFGSHPGLVMWHVSNEFGGECFCPLCVRRFQEYLEEKFDRDIEKLNTAWWAAFWSHRYNRFDQIEPPFLNGERSVMGLNLEWKRFTTWNTTDFMMSEISLLRGMTPGVSVTANFMKLFEGLDYRDMARELDVVSWDSYPRFHNTEESLYDTFAEAAFDHAVMRSMKREKPFMLMESVPSQVNWHPFNKLKRPGVHRLSCLQAVACGSDTVQYFQWRKGRGSFEQYHGAVVDHLGTDDTRVFREVAGIGELLKKLKPLAGTTVKAKAALLFDWDNRWAIEDMKGLGQQTKKYEETCIGIWKEFLKLGVEMDVISSDDSLEGYDVVIAPMLYLLRPGTAEKLKAFTARGGQLAATYLTGYVDENLLCFLGGFPGDGLCELFGIISEEIDTLYPDESNPIRFRDGTVCRGKEYAEILRVGDAEVLADYQEDFYRGTPAVTRKCYGDGNAYYIGVRTEPEELGFLWEEMLENAGVETRKLPEGVEYHVRSGEEGTYAFYLNYTLGAVSIEGVRGTELLGGEEISGSLGLEPYGAAVVKNN